MQRPFRSVPSVNFDFAHSTSNPLSLVAPLLVFVLFASIAGSASATCTLPNTLTNGAVADATQVMANFNSLKSCVDGAAALGGTPAAGNLAAFASSTSVTNGDLSGDVTTTGTLATTLANSGVAAGAYTCANVTFDAKGRATAAANGSCGGGGGGMTLIGSAIASGGSTASLTVGSIPGSYNQIWIVFNGSSSGGSVVDDLSVQFNGDTGGNYDWQRLHYYDTGLGDGQSVGATSGLIGTIPGAGAPTHRSSSVQILVPNYSNTTFDKEVTSTWGSTIGTGSFNVGTGVYSADWRPSTPAAITSVTVLPSAGPFINGSVLWVYGF